MRGRVPRERHEHFDAEGNLTGFTVVERESEWLESDVRELLELARVEGDSCPGCGWHHSFTDDQTNVFEPKDHVCPVCATKTRRERLLAHREGEAYKDSPPEAQRPSDGRYSTFALLSPEEVERRRGGGGGNQD